MNTHTSTCSCHTQTHTRTAVGREKQHAVDLDGEITLQKARGRDRVRGSKEITFQLFSGGALAVWKILFGCLVIVFNPHNKIHTPTSDNEQILFKKKGGGK